MLWRWWRAGNGNVVLLPSSCIEKPWLLPLLPIIKSCHCICVQVTGSFRTHHHYTSQRTEHYNHQSTGWPFHLFKTSRWLQNKSSTLAWPVLSWPGQNGTYVLKSAGCVTLYSIMNTEQRPRWMVWPRQKITSPSSAPSAHSDNAVLKGSSDTFQTIGFAMKISVAL